MSDSDVYEMLWNCKYCGATKLLGSTHRHCPNCGAPQDTEARYFPEEHEKVAVRDHQYVGADLRCGACGEASSARAKHCGHCGSPLAGASAVGLREDRVVDASGQEAARVPQEQRRPDGSVANPPGRKSAKKSLVLAALGAMALALVACLIVFFTWTRSETLEVVAHYWERSVQVERYQKVQDSAWCDELPSGAEVYAREKRQRSTKQVPDGEECKTRKKDRGDGTYQEVRECQPKYKSEPVHAERCRFNIVRWTSVRTEKESGRSLTEPPRWPTPQLKKVGQCLGCERTGKRTEAYTLQLREKKSSEPQECTLTEAKWRSFTIGQPLKAEVRQLGGSLDCSTLSPAG